MWKNQAVLRFFRNKKVRRQGNKIWREGEMGLKNMIFSQIIRVY